MHVDPNNKGKQPAVSGETPSSEPDRGHTPTREVTPRPDSSREIPEMPSQAEPISPSLRERTSPLASVPEHEGDSSNAPSEALVRETIKRVEYLATQGFLAIDPSKSPACKAVGKVIPSAPEELSKWLAESDNHVFAALSFALTELDDSHSKIKDQASRLIRAACEVSPEYSVIQLNCWRNLQLLSILDSLDQNQVNEAVGVFKAGNVLGMPMAAWMCGLIDLGLIPQIPPGNPRDCSEHLLSAGIWMNPDIEQKPPRVLEYSFDPCSFEYREKIAKTASHALPAPKRLGKEALKEENHSFIDQQLLPWYLKVTHGVCGETTSFEKILESCSDGSVAKFLIDHKDLSYRHN